MVQTAGTVRRGPTTFTQRTVAAASLGLALLAGGRIAPLEAAEKLPNAIVSAPRKAITFRIADGRQVGKHTYAILRVTRNGRAGATPKNMELDPDTGVFSWEPTESQAGTVDVAFGITDTTGGEVRVTRRITVKAGPIAVGTTTSADRKVAERLRLWYAAGTAAGNTGDFYDNRDGGHSKMRLDGFPQFDRFEYTDAQKAQKLHWGAQLRMLFTHVTIGNSSTSAPAAMGGCNTRRCLMSPRAAAILYAQYRRSHLYVYPEHRDYDPGHNGLDGGYGDLFPANTPYVITSQGSSGSDRAFLRAVGRTLAAFRPKVKALLIKTGLLMPTVQMIFRRCNSGVRTKPDYLTGRAHPPVFSPGMDVLKMVEMAHDMTPETIPPMIQLAVVEEDAAVPGRDYFGVYPGEKLFDTPAAIARVARSLKGVRRMVVSAKKSFDPNRRELTFHWVVLQGDADRITIKPLDSNGSVVELLIPYHARRPIHKGAAMQSNRVDIGAFVHNGTYTSAPGFISVYSLDNEARTYDGQGRIREVCYGYGATGIGQRVYSPRGGDIVDYGALIDLIVGKTTSLGAKLLREQFTPAEIAAFRAAATELAPAQAAIRAATGQAGAARELAAAHKAFGQLLAEKRPGLRSSVIIRIKGALEGIMGDLNFTFGHAEALAALSKACDNDRRKQAYRKAVAELHALVGERPGDPNRNPTSPFPTGPAGRSGPLSLTVGQRNRIEQLNIAVMQNILYPGVLRWQRRVNFVDPRLALNKTWRDVYRYAPDGRLIGWTRHRGAATETFTAGGARVTRTDRLGRPLSAQTVRYAADRTTKPWSVNVQPGDAILHYTYASDSDLIGRVARTEKR